MKGRIEWIIALVAIFLTAFGYAAAAQLCVKHFNLDKLDLVPYSTLISALIALVVPIKMGWYSFSDIKKNYKDFMWAGFCTKFIVVLGLASFVNPDLNAALATVLFRSPLIPVAFYVDYKLGEYLNFKDKLAFCLSILAIFIGAGGAFTSTQARLSSLVVIKSPWFIVTLGLYCFFYARRIPIIRKYARDVRYTGNEQFFTVQWIFFLFFILVPLTAFIVPNTMVGEVCQKMWMSMLTPNWKKIGAGFSIGIPFGLYASAAVWVINSSRNASQAAIVYKAIAGTGNAMAALAVVIVGMLPLFNIAQLKETIINVFLSSSAPSRYDWASVGIFLCATVVAGLGSAERSEQKKRRIQTPFVTQPSAV